MFLCALARPRFNNTTCWQWFDGLIGIYPAVSEFDSMYKKRRSANHARGDLKCSTSNFTLDRDEYQRMMINLVLPDIIKRRKMPINNHIIVQQDGAKAHLPVGDDPEIKAKVEQLTVWKRKHGETLVYSTTSSISW
jgi:hypothetical protein